MTQVAHVFPEFQSPVGHIRAKAAWVSGQYADIEFKNPQHFVGLLQCIVRGLRDPELPVRCALASMRALCEHGVMLEDYSCHFVETCILPHATACGSEL